MPLETMLRIYFLQSWYALSDPMTEERLDGSEAMRRLNNRLVILNSHNARHGVVLYEFNISHRYAA
jgi:hypothetical protein